MLNKKSFYKLFGLLSIFTITTPIITTAVSCSYDWLGAGGPSGGTTDGNSSVLGGNISDDIGNGGNQDGSGAGLSINLSQKEYIDYKGSFAYNYSDEYGRGGKWYSPYEVLLIPQSFFDEYVDKIKNNQIIWFDEQGNQIQYKITINIDRGFSTAPSPADLNSRVYARESYDKNIYFTNQSATTLEFILKKKVNDDNLDFWGYFSLEPTGDWTNDKLYKYSSKRSYLIPSSSQIGAVSFVEPWTGNLLEKVKYEDADLIAIEAYENNLVFTQYFRVGQQTTSEIKKILNFKNDLNSNLYQESSNGKEYWNVRDMNNYFTNVKGTVTIAKL